MTASTPGPRLLRAIASPFALMAAFCAFTGTARADDGAVSSFVSRSGSAAAAVGARLFADERFSNPAAGHRVSCASCHIFDERREERGLRGFCDFESGSRVPGRYGDGYVVGVRNSPTLFDVGEMSRLHMDGEFDSLESLVIGTFSGRTMGWLPGEEADALANAAAVLFATPDTADPESAEARPAEAGTYVGQLAVAFGVEAGNADAAVDLAARAVSDFMRGLRSPRNSPWDRFVKANALPAGPDEGESAGAHARGLVGRIRDLESSGALRETGGFGRIELRGALLFFSETAGNCFACHTPPAFSDHSFHTTGFSQLEYDEIHGLGSFMEEPVPGPGEADRPVERFRGVPSGDEPANTDLGFWNFADPAASGLRREAESEAAFLERMIGAFKTPTLRNLAITDPYIHSGRFRSLESVVREYIRLSDMARAGTLRSADDEMSRLRLSERDIAPLTAFLHSLNDQFP